MKCPVKDTKNKVVGDIQLDASVFGLPVRRDILSRMVRYQLAKAQAGTHQTKGISDISGTTKKPWNQKGTGRARTGSLRSPIFRGGQTTFGPQTRSHAFDLPKKVRKLALKTALSAKVAEKQCIVIDSLTSAGKKTKDVQKMLADLGITSALIIDGSELDTDFARATSNIPGIDLLPQQGANVRSILKRDTLVLTKDAVHHLEARLK